MSAFPDIRLELEAEEEIRLSPLASRAAHSRGRLRREAPDPLRTAYQRDIGRILYSLDFRRLRQKTQVFFNPHNDHICTRMEHTLDVSHIARTIGRSLRLNVDLIEAIALGHDVGHAPFGHSGEKELSHCLESIGSAMRFHHESHSLRVLDCLADYHGKKQGLNLSFEVRDGVVSHCGERYQECRLTPQRQKKNGELLSPKQEHPLPATLEGCVVRMADRIAYVGRDIEDAMRADLLAEEDIPLALRRALGCNNSEMINTLVTDIIRESQDQDAICLSKEIADALMELLALNVRQIYTSPKVLRYERIARQIIEGIFSALYDALADPEALAAKKDPVHLAFAAWLARYPFPEASAEVKLVDYIAGMTDAYATEAFHHLYQI